MASVTILRFCFLTSSISDAPKCTSVNYKTHSFLSSDRLLEYFHQKVHNELVFATGLVQDNQTSIQVKLQKLLVVFVIAENVFNALQCIASHFNISAAHIHNMCMDFLLKAYVAIFSLSS